MSNRPNRSRRLLEREYTRRKNWSGDFAPPSIANAKRVDRPTLAPSNYSLTAEERWAKLDAANANRQSMLDKIFKRFMVVYGWYMGDSFNLTPEQKKQYDRRKKDLLVLSDVDDFVRDAKRPIEERLRMYDKLTDMLKEWPSRWGDFENKFKEPKRARVYDFAPLR